MKVKSPATRAIGGLAAIVALALIPQASSAQASSATGAGVGLRVTIVSSPRPDLVTGAETLVRIESRTKLSARDVTVTLGLRNVSNAFVAQPDGSLLGLVTGVPQGRSTLVAFGRHHGVAMTVLKNHPRTGPVFSGPQQLPFFCETTAFGLAPAVQPFCEAPTVVTYAYRTTSNTFAALADPTVIPANAATATVDGRTVPYIVRLERGVIDRAVYEIATLHDGQQPAPTRTHEAWNKRLVYTFGGGCNVGYHQGASTGGVMNDLFLSRGYAVTSASLNVNDTNCNPVISAEVAMMVKEHFIETYGPVAHTIGWGGSGGAIQQHVIADNYPGILDGIIPSLSFPDPVSTSPTVGDCRLLNHYVTDVSPGYTAAQQNAVSGYGAWGSCVSWDRSFASRGNPTEACPSAIPVEYRFDPVTNPDGIKCTAAEQLVNQLGRDPATGFARSYTDNVGVQYGLEALKSGQISPEQFVDINEKVGGFNNLGAFVPGRSVADEIGLKNLYRSGLIVSATGGLRFTPIIDLRNYTDLVNDIHTRFWSFTLRDRLIAAQGNADNQVILIAGLTPTTANPQLYALTTMDLWLTAIAADHRSTGKDKNGQHKKVVRNKPADLVDGCWTSTGERINEPATWKGTGTCATLYPAFGDTRIAAGAPLRSNVLKCQLQPLNFAKYPVSFTESQRALLRAVFPGGVCDYTKQAVGQRPLGGTWQSY